MSKLNWSGDWQRLTDSCYRMLKEGSSLNYGSPPLQFSVTGVDQSTILVRVLVFFGDFVFGYLA